MPCGAKEAGGVGRGLKLKPGRTRGVGRAALRSWPTNSVGFVLVWFSFSTYPASPYFH